MAIIRNMQGTGLQSLAATAIVGTLGDGLTATGTTQATAMLISTDRAIFSTVPVGSGARLPQGGENDTYIVMNDSANALLLYPPVGGTISGGIINTPLSIGAGMAGRLFFQEYLTIRLDEFINISGQDSTLPINATQIPLIIAHRGYAGAAPQNTTMAWTNAITLHADGLECDLQISSDGVVYSFHDTTVDALTNGTGIFTELPSATIDSLIFDSTVGTPFSAASIPRFTDFLDIARNAGLKIFPEIKGVWTDLQMSNLIITLDSYGYNNSNCVIQAGYIVYVQTLRALSPTVGVTYVGAGNLASATPFINTLASLGSASIFWQMSDLIAEPSIVEYAYNIGVDVYAWTITQENDIRQLRAIGVNKLVCDSPVGGYV